MASIQNAFIYECNNTCWSKALSLAKERIKSEYKRDKRLGKEERIKKIAIGYIGEFAFKKWCELNTINCKYLGEEIGNEPDNGDFLCNDRLIIDVKTQEVFYLPKNNWRCEVTSDQILRPMDIYVFAKMFTKNNNRTLYLYGWMSHKKFKEKSIFRPKGTILKGKKVHYPKYDVTINELNSLKELKKHLKK